MSVEASTPEGPGRPPPLDPKAQAGGTEPGFAAAGTSRGGATDQTPSEPGGPRPEVAIGGAFAGGLLLALVLRRWRS